MTLAGRSVLALVLSAALFLAGCGGKTGRDPAPGPETPPTASEEGLPPAPETPERAPEAEQLRFIDAWGEWHDAQVDPGVEKHGYDWSGLRNDPSGIFYDGAGYTLRRGVDVSGHQGEIDWARVKADGIDFAIVRVAFRGYGSAGNLKEDATFRENIRAARAAGLDVGAYIFSQAVNEEEALEEAEFTLKCLEGLDVDLPVVFDPEHIRNDEARTDHVTGEQFTRNTRVFCDRIRQAGYQPMVYSNMIWEAFYLDLKELADIPVWYADYEPVPQTPYAFEFWQYSCTGRVAGIRGDVDLDVWFCKN